MKVVILPSIYYECVIESVSGASISRFFTNTNPLRSRELALTYLIELALSDGFNPDETLVILYVRHLKTGARIEVLTSATYLQTLENFDGLKMELDFYQKEKIKTHTVLYDYRKPNLVTILCPQYQNVQALKNDHTILLLAADYWVFLKKKKEQYLIA